jgi:hypothetical protein
MKPSKLDDASAAGKEVRGTALALLLAVSGRPVGPEELMGREATALSE